MDGDEHYVYTYDSEGRLLTGETSSFYTGSEFEEYTYDENGNVARYRWGDGSTEYTCDYTYNENGDVLTETNADGGVTRYEYNAAGLLVHSYDEPLNELSYQVFYTYDAVGKLLNVRYGQEYYGYSNISYTYDMYGNILTEVDDSEQYNSTYTYKYDSAGNIIYEKEEYGWDYWEYTYDSKGRLLESYEYLHDGSTTKEVYVYDAAGNVIRNEFTTTSYYGYVEEGVVLFNLCMVLESTYDDAGRIIREKVVISGEGTDETGTVTADYTYDANGNLVREETTTKDGVVVVTNEYKYFG